MLRNSKSPDATHNDNSRLQASKFIPNHHHYPPHPSLPLSGSQERG